MYKGGGGRCCHNCIQRNVECGESERGREVERDEGGRHRDGNLKLIPTYSGLMPRWRIFCQSFNILLFISGGQAGGLCSEWDGMRVDEGKKLCWYEYLY